MTKQSLKRDHQNESFGVSVPCIPIGDACRVSGAAGTISPVGVCALDYREMHFCGRFAYLGDPIMDVRCIC